jgi:hypothetical protein
MPEPIAKGMGKPMTEMMDAMPQQERMEFVTTGRDLGTPEGSARP